MKLTRSNCLRRPDRAIETADHRSLLYTIIAPRFATCQRCRLARLVRTGRFTLKLSTRTRHDELFVYAVAVSVSVLSGKRFIEITERRITWVSGYTGILVVQVVADQRWCARLDESRRLGGWPNELIRFRLISTVHICVRPLIGRLAVQWSVGRLLFLRAERLVASVRTGRDLVESILLMCLRSQGARSLAALKRVECPILLDSIERIHRLLEHILVLSGHWLIADVDVDLRA